MESNDHLGVAIKLAPNATYQAKDTTIERKFKGEHDEWLAKWVRLEQGAEVRETERTNQEYSMWMREEEMSACCPHLLSLRRTDTSKMESSVGEEKDSNYCPPTTTEKDEEFLEMREDVRLLISRAKKLISRGGGTTGGGGGGRVLSNTVGILSAYAKIGTLANAFQEYGALDLLLSLLSSHDGEVRRNSSEMLRSLANFDPSSRGYVLLQLIRSDGEGHEHSLQTRQMLLDLFSDTTSSEESDSLLKGITFPRVGN